MPYHDGERLIMIVYGAHISYVERDRLDITRKNAKHSRYGSVFAPSQWLVTFWVSRRRKNVMGQLDAWAKYVETYLAEMRTSYTLHRDVWDAVLSLDEVTLVCFCEDPNRCHRTVLAKDVFQKLGATYGGER